MRPGYEVANLDDASSDGKPQLLVQKLLNTPVLVRDKEDFAGLILDVACSEQVLVCEGIDGRVDILGLVVVIVVDGREGDEVRR